MLLPDDLSPAERLQIQRLLQEPPEPVYVDEPGPEPGAYEPVVGTVMPTLAVSGLDLGTGTGNWKGHGFTLPPSVLKRVLGYVADAIAASLRSEIERLRNEAK